MRRRLVLHAGLAKTGSTAIQHWCAGHRDRLVDAGCWYPPYTSPAAEQHAWLQRELRRGPPLAQLASHLATADTLGVEQLVLSSERISLNIDVFEHEAATAFADLVSAWDVDIVIVLRDESEWMRSIHRQLVMSMPLGSPTASPFEQQRATDATLAELGAMRSMRALCDETVVRRRFTEVFPACSLTLLRYGPDSVGQFAAHLGVDEWAADTGRHLPNTSVPDRFVEVIRQLNGRRRPRSVHLLARAAVSDAIGHTHTQTARHGADAPEGSRAMMSRRLLERDLRAIERDAGRAGQDGQVALGELVTAIDEMRAALASARRA